MRLARIPVVFAAAKLTPLGRLWVAKTQSDEKLLGPYRLGKRTASK